MVFRSSIISDFLTLIPDVTFRAMAATGWWKRRFRMDWRVYGTSSSKVSVRSSEGVSSSVQYGWVMSSCVCIGSISTGIEEEDEESRPWEFFSFSARGEMLHNFWFWRFRFALTVAPSWGLEDIVRKSGMWDLIIFLLSCSPKSLGEALMIVYLFIVATVLRPGIQAMTLWVTLSAR